MGAGARLGLMRAAALALVGLGLIGCGDDFGVDPDEGFIAFVETDEWPEALLAGATVTLRVTVSTEDGDLVDPDSIAWTASPAGRLTLLGAAGDSARFVVAGTGAVEVRAQLVDDAFQDASAADSIALQLAGIRLVQESVDTLRSLGDPIVLHVEGIGANGASFPATGWQWTVPEGAVEVVGSANADSLRLVATENGSVTIEVTHPDCAEACTELVRVTVRQRVSSLVAMPDSLRLTWLGQEAGLSASALDARGNPIAEVAVSYALLEGAGVVGLIGSNVIAQANGSARVEARAGGFVDEVAVTVRQLPATVVLSTPDTLRFGALGATRTMTAVIRDAGGSLVAPATNIVWVTTAPAIATVLPDPDDSTRALVTSTGNGSALVRLSVEGVVDSTRIIVGQRVGIVSILGGEAQTGVVGEQLTEPLVIAAFDSLGTPVAGATVTWGSSDGGAAVVGSAVTDADGAASATWTLGTLAGVQSAFALVAGDSVAFSATADPAPAVGVVASDPLGPLTWIGDTETLSATVVDQFGNPRADVIAWTSLDEAVATVNESGTVTAVANGNARIVATSDTHADTVDFVISQVIASLDIDPPSSTMIYGDTLQPTVSAADSGGTAIDAPTITWHSTEPAVATVDEAGTVAAFAPGQTEIVATSDSAEARLTVTVVSWALSFDGGDYVSVASAPALDLASVFTIEAWVRPTGSGGTDAIVAMWNGNAGGSSYQLVLEADVPTFRTRSGATTSVLAAPNALTPGQWHHVAFTFEHGAGVLYVNGVGVASASGMTVPALVEDPLRIGNSAASGGGFTGSIDEVRLWTVARSAAEIAGASGIRLSGTEAGLSAYWPFTEGPSGNPVDRVGGLVGTRGTGASTRPAWTNEASPVP